MTTWLYQIYLFIRAADATQANRNAFVAAYVDNGSGESSANEAKMFDSVVRLSTTGAAPAQAYGISSPAKLDMRNALKSILDGLTNARYAVVANVAHGQFREGELILTNVPGLTPNGQIVTWADALEFVEQEFGLRVIPPQDS